MVDKPHRATAAAAAASTAASRRVDTIARHVLPSSPLFSTSANVDAARFGNSNVGGFKDDRPHLGTFKLGPHVSIPVFEPKHPSRLPAQRLLLNLDDPIVLEHLEFLGKKWQLGQDVFLLSPPGPYARRLSLTFAALLQLPYEYVSFHRDIGETDLLQSRSLTAGGNLVFDDGPVVRAMKNGHLLILEGVQRVERGVTPIINNILENREQNLPDGRHLIPAEKLTAARQQEAFESGSGSGSGSGSLANDSSRFIPCHPDFRVIAIGLPIPLYKGLELDPPFRSRFQARWIEGSVSHSVPLLSQPTSPLADQLCQRWAQWAGLLRYYTVLAQGNDVLPPTAKLAGLPSTAVPLLADLVTAFPPTQPLPKVDGPDGETDPIEPSTSKVETSASFAPSTLALLSSAYPQLYSFDQEKRGILHDLLSQLHLDQGLGEGIGQDALSATGYMGYLVEKIDRVSASRAKVTFRHAADPTCHVEIEVPCGPLPLAPIPHEGQTTVNGSNVVITRRVLSIFTRLVQLHAVGRDVCLVPANSLDSSLDPTAASAHQPSSSTTTCISLMASCLGYAYEAVWLWKDLGGNELLMRRATAPDGSTSWEPAPLIKGALDGKLIHLAGVDVLGPTLAILARLMQDRESELWNGARLTLDANEAKSESLPHASQSVVGADSIASIRDSFRVVATAPKAAWLNEETSTLFATLATSPMDEIEERDIVLRVTGIDPQNVALDRLHQFVNRYRALSADPNLGLNKARRLGTRQLIRMAMRLARWPEHCDLHALIWRSLLVDFLPGTVRQVITNLLHDCGIHKPGTEDAFQYIPKLWLQDPEIAGNSSEDRRQAGNLEFGVTDGLADMKYQPRVIPRFNVATHDVDGKALIPDLGNSFFNNPQQNALICSFAEDLEILGEHLLLMGSQGTDKNKIIDRTLELLDRPREYIQLSRDSTVSGILQQVALENGQIRYYDSPLVRAVKLGRILVVDEADKCSTAVTAVFKSLAERSELSLPDGRRIRPAASQGGPNDIVVHPHFRLILLSNRPGWPFFGNNFIDVIGEGFSCYAVANPDVESEVRVLRSAAPNVPVMLLRQLGLAFHDLRKGFEAGLINHLYSLRELLHIVAHMQKFPEEPLSSVLLNALSFDLHRPEAIRWVVETLRKRNLPIDPLSIEAIREHYQLNLDGKTNHLKLEFEEAGKQDFDPEKAGRKTDLDQPKDGKIDPNNDPHVGGNTYHGGTGGRDTLGLGGRGGYGRMYKGHEIHQISDRLKQDVPDHIKKQAQQMAREALERELNQNALQSHELINMHEMKQRVAIQVQHLSNVVNDLKANQEECTWLSRQQEGELDEKRLAEARTGERGIFKRRLEQPPEPGAPFLKPKRIRIVCDASASMYHMQFDGRLQRQLETTLMLLQMFSKTDSDRFVFDLVAHTGDEALIPLTQIDKIPSSDGDQYRILRSIVSQTQYCSSGDHTLQCIQKSIQQLSCTVSEYDDTFLIVMSDANLARYGISSSILSNTMKVNDKIKTAIIFLDHSNEGTLLQKQLPSISYVDKETKQIPRIMSNILTSMLT